MVMDIEKLTAEEAEQWTIDQFERLEQSPEYIKLQELSKRDLADCRIKVLDTSEETDLTKENCTLELWEELGGDQATVNDKDLPF
jgi:hypothetical protein